MDSLLLELLLAERGGRLIAIAGDPAPGQTWRMRLGPGRVGAAMAAAARWADRFGAKVLVALAEKALDDPTLKTLVEGCRRLCLLDPLANRDDIPVDHLEIIAGRSRRMIESVPSDALSWAVRLDSQPSRLFVRLAEAGDRVKSCAASREVDRRAIDDFAVPGLCLMENAGSAAVILAMDMLDKTRHPGGVLVTAGGGNNAGDGFVVARGLAALGRRVTVALLKDHARLSPDAAANLRLLEKLSGVTIADISNGKIGEFARLLDDTSLIVDALLGTGFAGEVSEPFRKAIERMNDSRIQILSLDIPSGLSGDSGRADPQTVRASRTITFANLKTGLVTGAGPEKCGLLYIGEIGAPRPVLEE